MAHDMIVGGFGSYPKTGIYLPSASYLVDPTPEVFGTEGAVGLNVLTNISAISGTTPQLVVNVQGFSPAENQWVTLVGSAALTATGHNTLVVDPRVAIAANKSAGQGLMEQMRIVATNAGSTGLVTLNYSITYTLQQ